MTAMVAFGQDQSMAYYNAGNQLYAQKNYDQAIRYYQAAVQVNPNMWQADQGLGNCYYAKGDKASALASYQKALQINPNNPQLSSFTQSLQAQVGSSPALPGAASPAASAAPAGGASDKFELDLHGNVAMGGTGYGMGFGGGARGFAPMGGGFMLGGMLGYYTFAASVNIPGYSASISFIELMAGAKYKFTGDSMRPYLFGGAGMSNVTVSASYSGVSASLSEMDPMIAVGGGVEFPMGKDMNFFAEAQYSMVMTAGASSSYIPIGAGINFGL